MADPQQQQHQRHQPPEAQDQAKRSPIKRIVQRLDRKRRRLSAKCRKASSKFRFDDTYLWSAKEYAERQNSVGTLELFKFAQRGERAAVLVGVVALWYAASWQPISVFILAIMASLMGEYSKQVALLARFNETSRTNASLPAVSLSGLSSGADKQSMRVSRAGANSLDYLASPFARLLELAGIRPAGHGGGDLFVESPSDPSTSAAPLTSELSGEPAAYLRVGDSPNALTPDAAGAGAAHQPPSYDGHQFSPLHSIMGPLFDLGFGGARESQGAPAEDLLRRESDRFLRRSFEINGSAFLLALTQLLAFFLGMSLITWAAKRQAARVKLLYFSSCLHQEVTWFESIDSAGGSGSSLNALVEKYEDGIGVKLALLCYFLGHVALFALTAFYQLFGLATFCMPFVLTVGLVIGYLSERQARAIGQHALFAKRSLQLAEEILAAIRTVFAFNGQQKELTRYGISLQPVYRRSLVKHLYTALNTSLSKFSIFACFSAYCFYAMRLFPPYDPRGPADKSTVLAVMRGAEVSIVNILISIPFMEALQQSKGSIARIYAAIERRSKIDAASERGARPPPDWQPSLSFRMVQFGYADRSGPTRRNSTVPFIDLPGSPGCGQQVLAKPNIGARRQSLIEELADGLAMESGGADEPPASGNCAPAGGQPGTGAEAKVEPPVTQQGSGSGRRPSAAIRRLIGSEIEGQRAANRRVLSYFNLEIKAGQSVALVGPSGSGKSTVLSLVQRLYDTTGGQLLVGQHNIKDLEVRWLRNQISVVTQEPRLFDMTIAENIRLGLSADQDADLDWSGSWFEASVDDDLSKAKREANIMQQVVEAAREANAHEFIVRLPDGYATRVGSGGFQLSGGQKQRIAIARALIRRPKILLLDESTSALDTESESLVQQALRLASAGRTTITVAHRLSTVRDVDLIAVVSQGQVVECGSHEELMGAAEGVYRQMYEQQLSSVRKRCVQPSDQERVSARREFAAAKLAGTEADAGRELDEDEETDEDSDYDDAGDPEPSEKRPSAWQLWRFIEMPRWSAAAALLICLLAGLILPMNLIAHSYLFSAFAYEELEQIGDYLHAFGLIILSFSTFVFIVTFLQVLLPGYVGEKLSSGLRAKIMEALLSKPMFYFDMDANSASALCDRFNSYIASIQSIAGTRMATMLEALSTLAAGAVFGFGQNLALSLFCISFALLVLVTTIVESRLVQREATLQRKLDASLAHLMADALSNIKTVASLNKERFFIARFRTLLGERENG